VCEFNFGAWPIGHDIIHDIKYKSCSTQLLI